MEENTSNHNLNNLLGKQVKGTEKQRDSKISLDLNKFVTHPNTLVPFENCIRVQKDYFFEYKDDFICINKDVINTDYGSDSVKKVRKYLKFINNPEHINYQKEMGLYYNLYRPLVHKPLKGIFPNIEKMLKHIFRGKHYEMIMTYMWVLYIKPKHPLPFIGLVSVANGTGKTKFLQFIKAIYKANAIFIDADDISDTWNDHYIDKLCILIDEKIDGKNRKADLQKYKKLITGGTQSRKARFQSAVDVEFYGKFSLCSNDDQTMMALEEENTRFWIIDVPKLEETDVNILEKSIVEIPAFLYHLEHEYEPLKQQGRLWLSSNDIQTERGKVIRENSRSDLAKEVIERLKDYFTEHISLNEITFSANHLIDSFTLKNISVNYLGRVLKSEFGKKDKDLPIYNPFPDYVTNPKRCRCYTFTREEIMGVEKDEKADQPPPKNGGDKEYYDPDWVDGEFD